MRGRGSDVAAWLVPVLLVLSGETAIAAASQRWWPACPWGGFDSEACLLRQDHLYDQVFPAEPWEPVGHAAELHAVSLVLLAAAVVGIAWLVARAWARRSIRVAIYVAHVPVCTAMLWTASTVWSSGRQDTVVETSVAAVLTWALGWPLLLLAMALWEGAQQAPRRWSMILFGILAVASPIPQFMFAPAFVLYLSHDSAPWSDAVAGVLFLVAGAVAAAGLFRASESPERSAAERRRPQSQPGAPVARR